MVFQCAPMFSACVFHCGSCFPFVRRTAVEISVNEDWHDVRCGIAFFCAHTSMVRCKGNHWIGQPWPINLLFSSFARETRPGFVGLKRRWPDVPFLKLFESLSFTELAVLAGALPRGSQVQAYLSTDGDRTMVAKPLTECNIVFAMLLDRTSMSSTLLLTVIATSRAHVWRNVFEHIFLEGASMSSTLLTESTRRLVHMQRAVSPLFCFARARRFFSADWMMSSQALPTPSNPLAVPFVRVLHACLLSYESADVRAWFT